MLNCSKVNWRHLDVENASLQNTIRKHLLTGKSDNIVHKGNCLICKWSRCSLRITKLSVVSVHQGLHRILGHCNQCCIRRPQSNHQSDLEPNIALLFFPFLHSPNVQTWEYMRATSKQGKMYLWQRHHMCVSKCPPFTNLKIVLKHISQVIDGT